MDAQVLSMAGTALSALIAATGYYLKTKHERRRATRVALYHLLELHHRASRSHFVVKEFPNLYVSNIHRAAEERGIHLADSDVKRMINILRGLLRSYAISQLNQLTEVVARPFSQALDELAREDPVLAFRLKGSEAFQNFIKIAQQVIAAGVPIDPASTPLVAETAADLHDLSQAHQMDDLAASVRAAAWQCGVSTYIRSLYWVRRSRNAGKSEADKKRMEATISVIIEHAQRAEAVQLAQRAPGS